MRKLLGIGLGLTVAGLAIVFLLDLVRRDALQPVRASGSLRPTPGQVDFSSPAATFRTFLDAMRRNDLETAKRCWNIDDDNRSGVLDVMLGRWIAARKLVAVTDARLGANGMELLGRWNQPDLSDEAIERTMKRLGDAEIVEREDVAKLKFRWDANDGETMPVFLYYKAPFALIKCGEHWKIDANLFLDAPRASELMRSGSIWVIWKEEMNLMLQTAEMLEKRKIQTVPQFKDHVKESVDALKARFAAEGGK